MAEPARTNPGVEGFGIASAGQVGYLIIYARRTVPEPLANNQAARLRQSTLRLFQRTFVEF
jgi:hypothetical protein